MTEAQPAAAPSVALPWVARLPQRIVQVSWALCMIWLGFNFFQYFSYALCAILFPYGLNYGEGIVWQQAELIFGQRAYGDIMRFPYVVFHYPPIYHVLVRAVSGLGLDMLAAGRGLSVASACMAAVSVGWLTMQGTYGAWRGRVLAGAVAGLALFTFGPFVLWSPLMRVDLVALAFSLGGTACIVASFRRPVLLYLGVILFLLAAFTKQTAVAAPLAALGIVVLRTPRRGVQAILLGAVFGGAVLVGLQEATAGGFLRHIATYNLNRFSLAMAASTSFDMLSEQFIYYGLAALALAARSRRLRPDWRGPAGLLQLMRKDDQVAWSLLMGAYLALSTATLVASGKSGAGPNYFLEWIAVVCVWLGVRAAEPVPVQQSASSRVASTMLMPLALIAQGVIQPQWAPHLRQELMGSDHQQDRAAMADFVSRIPSPVLSDDMVSLLRAGKQVPLEPAIFAELAATDRWPESLLLRMLDDQVFSAVITEGGPEQSVFKARFLPATRAAIARNYNRVANYGVFQVWTRQ